MSWEILIFDVAARLNLSVFLTYFIQYFLWVGYSVLYEDRVAESPHCQFLLQLLQRNPFGLGIKKQHHKKLQ